MKTINADEIKNLTIKDFMEWYAKEYDGQILASDYNKTIDILSGYIMGKGDCEEAVFLNSAKYLLIDARNFFDVVSRYTKWKYRG